jgi:hypothetical protein
MSCDITGFASRGLAPNANIPMPDVGNKKGLTDFSGAHSNNFKQLSLTL